MPARLEDGCGIMSIKRPGLRRACTAWTAPGWPCPGCAGAPDGAAGRASPAQDLAGAATGRTGPSRVRGFLALATAAAGGLPPVRQQQPGRCRQRRQQQECVRFLTLAAT